MRDHRIVGGIRVLGDIEVLLHHAPRIGQERPMRVDAGPVLVRRNQIVRADGDEAAIADLHLAMELNQALRLPAVFRAVSSAAEHHDHRVGSLQIGKLAALGRVIGQFVIGKNGARYDVCSHEVRLSFADNPHRRGTTSTPPAYPNSRISPAWSAGLGLDGSLVVFDFASLASRLPPIVYSEAAV